TIRDGACGRADQPRRRAPSRDVGDPRPTDLARRAGTARPTRRSPRPLRYEDRRSRVRDASRVRRRGDPGRRPWPSARGRRERRGRARERPRRRHAAHRAAPLESVMPSARVAVLGDEALRASVVALGFEPSDTSPEALVVDLRDAAAVRRAAAMTGVPRVFVGSDAERPLVAALGLDASFVAGIEPARLGPALVRILPTRARAATRMMVVTGARGGVGRTLLATNVARRIAKQRRVWLLDATGSGAAAWWLSADPRSWPSLEALVHEMSVEQ